MKILYTTEKNSWEIITRGNSEVQGSKDGIIVSLNIFTWEIMRRPSNDKLKVGESVNFLFDYFQKQLDGIADDVLRKTKS